MALTEEQIANIKEQLFKQIEKFPEEQQETIREQIEGMDAEQLEQFLEQNKLMKQGGGGCIFCSIVKEETPSYKIAENNEAIAVLDINPISKGHSLIIPKEHKPIDEIPSALQFAHEVAKKIKKLLAADDIKTESSTVQGHGIINIIPLYKDQKLEKKKASEEELQELQKKLKVEEKKPEEKPKKPEKPKKIRLKDLPKAPRRIP